MTPVPNPFPRLPGDPCTRGLVAGCLLMGLISVIVVLDFGGYPNAPHRYWVFEYNIRTQDLAGALLLMALVMLACLAPAREATLRLVDAISRHPWRTAGVAFVALCLGAVLVEHGHAMAQDEYAALFQSRAFAAGHLTGQFPPELIGRLIPYYYLNQFIYGSWQTGQVASAYWPGFALLLTPFSLLNAPWACNPFLACLALVLMGKMAVRLSGEPRAAGWAMLLALASPGFTAMAITYFSMTAHLLFNLAFAWLVMGRTPARLLLAGAVGSFALILHNPMPHTLFALPWILWLAVQPDRYRNLLALAAGYAPIAASIGFGWAALLSDLQGNALHGLLAHDGNPVNRVVNFFWNWHVRMRSAMAGAGDDVLAARGAEAVRLWNWAVPGLPLLAAVGWWLARRDRRALLLGFSMLATAAGYLLIGFNQGNGWGARYLHPAWGVLPVLAAVALVRIRPGHTCERLSGYVATLALLSLLAATTLRMTQIHGLVESQLANRPPAERGVRQIVFITLKQAEYTMDLVQNDPFLRDPVWYMMSYGDDRDADFMRAKFPGARRERMDARGSVWRLEQQR